MIRSDAGKPRGKRIKKAVAVAEEIEECLPSEELKQSEDEAGDDSMVHTRIAPRKEPIIRNYRHVIILLQLIEI
jgi:hypothetical protein